MTAHGQLAPWHEAALDAYFVRFAPPNDGKCLNCGDVQGGLMAQLTGTGFAWGIAHGEGYCRTCRYPGRALHYDVGPIKRLGAILQYHPDFLTSARDA